ncbi:MAG: FAD-binding oxidoreductase [Planctomycetota bacterium]|nr:FAD-binding oxidoreductase [Planctomycetota bacterium]
MNKSATPHSARKNPKPKRLSGWGHYPKLDCNVFVQRRIGELQALLQTGDASLIARGLGRSYGDSAINRGGVILQRSRDRILSFDPESGSLTCEAGVSLEEIIQVVLPKGWFLPTTPGTKFVTVGGAIAADVHGKNHHRDGTWGQYVQRFSLMIADGKILECSHEQNADVFWATIGGMGLTGIVLEATVQLMQVSSAYVDVNQRKARNLNEVFDLFMETDQKYKYSVAWIDCLSRGSRLGRSVLFLGNDASADLVRSTTKRAPLVVPRKRTKSIPMQIPRLAMNKLAVKAFNGLYYWKHGNKNLLVDYDSYFYPLDSVHHWNRIYGKRGFVQYQALLPRECSREGMTRLLEIISKSGEASFLAVLKSSGAANQGILSYLFDGHTLALDFPYRGAKTERLCRELDEVMLDFRGRVYLAKDALVSADTFVQMYPRVEEFKQIKKRLDPETVFRSNQSDRIGIT